MFVETGTRTIHIAEMAHIIAASSVGPRADVELTDEQKGAYDNLILLCPRCHTVVDKTPDEHPEKLLLRWKADHSRKVAEMFGAIEYESREKTRAAIEPALAENRAIFNQYSPENEYRENPESELSLAWRRRVRERIIPNNRKILAVLDVNRRWLDDAERMALEDFRQHVSDIEARHLGEELPSAARRFPVAMNRILTEKRNE